MKILFVTSSQSFTAEMDQALQLAAGLGSRGHDIHWMTSPGAQCRSRAAAVGLPVHLFASTDFKRHPLRVLGNLSALRSVIVREGPDVVYALESQVHTLCAMALLGSGRCALVRWRGTAQSLRGGLLSRHLYDHRTRAVLAPCFRQLERARAAGFQTRHWSVIDGSVDLDRFRPGPADPAAWRELGFPEETELVALVARLAPVKGIPVFLEALARLRERRGGAAAVILGEAWEGQEEEFHARSRALGLSRAVRWLGRRADVDRWLRLARIGVVSSLGSEMHSRAALEYMASGLPVAATRVGVLPEWLQGKAFARLVPPGDPEALASAIAELLAAPDRAGLGSMARAEATRRFSPERFLDQAESALVRAAEGA